MAEHLEKDSLQDLIDLIKEAFNNVRADINTLNTVGLIVNDDLLNDFVADWLADHPEATTTIADGSVTYAKLASALQTLIDGKADEQDVPTKTSDLTNDSGFITALPHTEMGTVSITPKKNKAVTNVQVTFSEPFTNIPVVVATARTTVPNVITSGVSDVTTTSK